MAVQYDRFVIRIFLVFLVPFLIVLVGCPTPLDEEENLIGDVAGPLIEDASVEDPEEFYNTRPTWQWSANSDIQEPPEFRYRLDEGDWILPEPPGVTSITWPEDLFPGTYSFQVQQRTGVESWSSSSERMTTILVREPVFETVPDNPTDDRTPVFTWRQWTSNGDDSQAQPLPQFGATNSFSYLLEQLVGDEWIGVPGAAAANQQDLVSYSVPLDEPLADGFYRFGVAEHNEGGAVSAYEYHEFQVQVLYGGLELTITLVDPAQPGFVLPSPGPVTRGDDDLVTVTLESETEDIAFDEVIWTVNGAVASGEPVTFPATSASLTLDGAAISELPLGINRIAVMVLIGEHWFSSDDMTFEVVQP